MRPSISFIIRDQQLWLSPQRAVYWESRNTLILSDLHFGKSGHFRKSGIPIPQEVFRQDLHRLFDLVQYFQPSRLIFVGDFFHSSFNKEANLFARWRMDHAGIAMTLIKGNHDILSNDWYANTGISLHESMLQDGPFGFVHEWNSSQPLQKGLYYLSGHVHPGVRILGGGKQSFSLPCFYFEKDYAILPAFSHFTGLALVKPSKTSRVFVIANDQVHRFP